MQKDLEISVSTRGSVRGTQVNESLTYVARPTSAGVLHGEGQGVIMTGIPRWPPILVVGSEDLLLPAQNGAERFTIGHRQPVSCHFLTMLLESMKPKWTRREISQRRSGNGSK